MIKMTKMTRMKSNKTTTSWIMLMFLTLATFINSISGQNYKTQVGFKAMTYGNIFGPLHDIYL